MFNVHMFVQVLIRAAIELYRLMRCKTDKIEGHFFMIF